MDKGRFGLFNGIKKPRLTHHRRKSSTVVAQSQQASRWLSLKTIVPAATSTERLLASLSDDIISALPYRSGNELDLEQPALATEQTALFCNLAVKNVDYALACILSELDLLQRMQASGDFIGPPLLKAQFFLFHLVLRCLEASNATPISDAIAVQLISLVSQVARLSETDLAATLSLERIAHHDGTRTSSLGHVSSSGHRSTSSTATPLRGSTDSIAKFANAPAPTPSTPVDPQKAPKDGFNQKNGPLPQIVQLLAWANWPVFLNRLQTRFASLGSDDTPDIFELRFISWVYLDYQKLAQLLQAIEDSDFAKMKRATQTAVCSSILTAILHFMNRFPHEMRMLHQDGGFSQIPAASSLFDALFNSSDSKKKGNTWQWATLASLLVLCPATLADLDKVEVKGKTRVGNMESALRSAFEGSSIKKGTMRAGDVFKKGQFLEETLVKGIKSDKTVHHALQAFVLLWNAASLVPSSSALRTQATEFWKTFQGIYDISQPNFSYVDLASLPLLASIIGAIFRLDPSFIARRFLPAAQRSAPTHISRAAAVSAVSLLVDVFSQASDERRKLEGILGLQSFSGVLNDVLVDNINLYEDAELAAHKPADPSTLSTVQQVLDLWNRHPFLAVQISFQAWHLLLDLVSEGTLLDLNQSCVDCITALVAFASSTTLEGRQSTLAQVVLRDCPRLLSALAYVVLIDHGETSYPRSFRNLCHAWRAVALLLRSDPPSVYLPASHLFEPAFLSLEIVFVLALSHSEKSQATRAVEAVNSLHATLRQPRSHIVAPHSILSEIEHAGWKTPAQAMSAIAAAANVKASICAIFEEGLRRWQLASTSLDDGQSENAPTASGENFSDATSLLMLLFVLAKPYMQVDRVQASDLSSVLPARSLPPHMLQTSAKPQVLDAFLRQVMFNLATQPWQRNTSNLMICSLSPSLFGALLRQSTAALDSILARSNNIESSRNFALHSTILLDGLVSLSTPPLDIDRPALMSLLARFVVLFPPSPSIEGQREFQLSCCRLLKLCSSVDVATPVLRALRSWVIANLRQHLDIALAALGSMETLQCATLLASANVIGVTLRWLCFFDRVFELSAPDSDAALSSTQQVALEESSVSCCSRLIESLPALAAKAIRSQSSPHVRVLYMKALTTTSLRCRNLLDLTNRLTPSDILLRLLCQPDLSLVMAICDATPANETDDIAEVLLNTLGCSGLVERFVEAVLRREIMGTDHEATVMRGNSLHSRILTVYGKAHGYLYLRYILKDTLEALCRNSRTVTNATGEDEEVFNRSLESLSQAFLDIVTSDIQRVPTQIRYLCTNIARFTEERFPSSSPLQASGGYIFLRLLNPAIINPESIDLDVPTENVAQVRKSLIHVTKILQSLSNSIKTGHRNGLTPSWNLDNMTTFLDNVSRLPSVDHLTIDQEELRQLRNSETMGPVFNQKIDTGELVFLESFVSRHSDRIQNALLANAQKNSNLTDSVEVARSTTLEALKQFKNCIAGLEQDLACRRLDDSLEDFMRRTGAWSSLNLIAGFDQLFFEGGISKAGHHLICLNLRAYVRMRDDVEALMRNFLDRALSYSGTIDLLLDATMFTNDNEMDPDHLAWLVTQLSGHITVGKIFIYNPSLSFYRYFKSLARKVAVSSVVLLDDDDFERFIPKKDLALCAETLGTLQPSRTAFTQVFALKHYRPPCPCIFSLSATHLVIRSLKRLDFGASLSCQTVDFIPFDSIIEVNALARLDSADAYDIVTTNGNFIFLDCRSQLGEVAAAIRHAVQGRRQRQPIDADQAVLDKSPAALLLAKTCLQLASDDVHCEVAAFQLGTTFATNTFRDHRQEKEELVGDIALAHSVHTPAVLDLLVENCGPCSSSAWTTIARPWFRNLALVHDTVQKDRCRGVLTRFFARCQDNPSAESIMPTLAKIDTLTPILVDSILRAFSSVRFDHRKSELGYVVGNVAATSKLVRELRNNLMPANSHRLYDAHEWPTISSILLLLDRAITTDPVSCLTMVPELLHLCAIVLSVQDRAAQDRIAKLLDGLTGAMGLPTAFIGVIRSPDYLDRLEEFADFFLRAIDQSPQECDLKNAWRCRWMSLTASSVFQYHPYCQTPAMLLLGHFIDSAVEDELLFQVLVAYQTCFALSAEPQADQQLLLAAARTLKRLVPLVSHNSSYLLSLPWIALIVLESGVPFLFEPAIGLLETSLSHLRTGGIFIGGNCTQALVKARSVALSSQEASLNLDAVAGMPRLEAHLSWAIVALCLRGLLFPAATASTERLFSLLLQIMVVKEAPCLPTEALPVVIVLLLASDSGVEEQITRLGIKAPSSLLSRLSLDNFDTQMMAMALLTSMIHITQDLEDSRHGNVLDLIAEIAKTQPACAVAYADLLEPIALNGLRSSSPVISQASRRIASALTDFNDRPPMSGKIYLEQKGLSFLAGCALEAPLQAQQQKVDLAVTALRDLLY